MNFKLSKRLMALPFTTAERAVTASIAFHVDKDGDSSYPSYKTIHKESGAANKTISKVIRTLRYVGVLDWSHRANILTGKESNLYRFTFEGIRFNRDKLSKADYAAIESKLKKARKTVTAEMAADSSVKKPKIAPSIPSQMLRADTVTNVTAPKSQSVNNDVRAVTGSEGSTIPSQMLPKQSQMLRRSNNDNVPSPNACRRQNTSVLNESQNQKRFDRMKSNNTATMQGQDFDCLPEQKQVSQKKRPQEQTRSEWLADFTGG